MSTATAVTYTLLHPVELTRPDGSVIETLRELTLGRINGADARKVINAQGKGNGDFVFELICATARIAPSTFNKLDAEDVMELAVVAAPFLGKSPPT